jgi:hypothetical protein
MERPKILVNDSVCPCQIEGEMHLREQLGRALRESAQFSSVEDESHLWHY